MPHQPLITLTRDPAHWPNPHSAEVPQSCVREWVIADQGWTVGDQQPEGVRRLATLEELGLASIARAAVLCPGPSLTQAWAARKHQHQATIGVNRAPFAVPVDWWCGLDDIWNKWTPAPPPPRVGYCGAVASLTGSAAALIPRDGLAAVVTGAPEGCPSFTALAAVAFAFEVLKADKVDVYGCDLAGEADFDGLVEKANNRTEQRWKEERDGWAILRKRYGRRLTIVKWP